MLPILPVRNLSRRLLALFAALLLAAAGPARALASGGASGTTHGESDRLDLDRGDSGVATLGPKRSGPPSRSLPRTDATLLAPLGPLPGPAWITSFEQSLPRALHPSIIAARRGARAPPSAR